MSSRKSGSILVEKTGFWNIHPFLSSNSAHSLYPYIFVPKWMYNSLASDNPDPFAIASLLHEEVHLKRQKEIGLIKFGFLYILSRKFRLKEELLALKPQMKYLHKNRIEFDIRTRAKNLSGLTYLWCTSYTKALSQLTQIKNELSQ